MQPESKSHEVKVVFIVTDETGGGIMREAKLGETLEDFVKWTTEQPLLWADLTHGRSEPEAEGGEGLAYRDLNLSTYGGDETRQYGEDLARFAAQYNATPVRYDRVMVDDELALVWTKAEVPDWTKYVYFGGCHQSLGGWNGMGGNGYVSYYDEALENGTLGGE